MENKNKLTVSSSIAIVLLLIMVAGASIAYFGSFKQDVNSTANLNVSLALGGTGTTYKCLYDIVYEYDSNSDVYGSESVPVTNESKKELTLTVSSSLVSGTNNFSEEKNFAYDSSWESVNNTFRKTIVKDATIIDSSMGGTTNTWNLNLKFYLLSESQAKVQGKTFTGSFFVDNIRCGVK